MKATKIAIATLAVTAVAYASAPDLPNLAPGTAAPAFTLPDTNGKSHNLSDFKGKWVVLEWTNHQCPVVVRHYANKSMQETQKWATDQGVVWLSIVSSKPGAQGAIDGPKGNEVMKEKGFKATAKLLDPSGTVGKAYGAKTTPHMYIIDPNGTLVYNGAIDDNNRGNKTEVRNHVREALKEGMAGKPITVASSQPYGCSVKY